LATIIYPSNTQIYTRTANAGQLTEAYYAVSPDAIFVLSGSALQTSSYTNAATASYISSSAVFDTTVYQLTAVSASYAPGSTPATYTSSLFGTSSWAVNALSASSIPSNTPLTVASLTLDGASNQYPINSTTTINNYSEMYNQNLSFGTTASTDVSLENNLGTAITYFVDMGINGSNYADGYVGNGSDAYLFSTGSNKNSLYIGSTDISGSTCLFAGNYANTGSGIQINTSSVTINLPLTTTSTIQGTSSWASSSISASYAPGSTPATYTSSLFGTASWANNTVSSVSASFVSASNISPSQYTSSLYPALSMPGSLYGCNVGGHPFWGRRSPFLKRRLNQWYHSGITVTSIGEQATSTGTVVFGSGSISTASFALFQTPGSVNSASGFSANGTQVYFPGKNIYWSSIVALNTTGPNMRASLGLTAGSITQQETDVLSNKPNATLRYSNFTTDSFWMFTTSDGTTANTVTTSLAPNLSQTLFEIIEDTQNNRWLAFANETLIASSSIHYPTASVNTSMQSCIYIQTLDGTVKTMQMAGMYGELDSY